MTYAKFLTALATALAVSNSLLPDGVTANEWITIGLAFLGALGVYAIPNTPKAD